MRRFTFVCRDDADSESLCESIKHHLETAGLIYDSQHFELVICVGGDGTLLSAFHTHIEHIDAAVFVGIHSGTLGFNTDYTQDNLQQFLHDVIHNEPIIEEKRILEAVCINDTTSRTFYALNEVRVENIVKTQKVEVYLNDSYFETFRGNGLCISGQYGSTAYNRSIGGAIIFPGLDLLQMTEISGIHHRHSRSLTSPLILNPEMEITLRNETFKHALLCYDHLHIHLDDIHEIRIFNSTKTMKFAHFNQIPHIQRLNALF